MLAYTEAPDHEMYSTSIGFPSRAKAPFDAQRMSRMHRLVTEYGANYWATDATLASSSLEGRRQRMRPGHNGEGKRQTDC